MGYFSKVKRLCQERNGESPLDGERRDWSELIGKKSGEIKGSKFYLDHECPYHLSLSNGADGPKRMRGRVGIS